MSIQQELFDIVTSHFEKALEMLNVSESPMAAIVQVEGETNVRRCRCAFCIRPLQVGEGHPYNAFHGTRYLCDNCYPPLIASTFIDVLEGVTE